MVDIPTVTSWSTRCIPDSASLKTAWCSGSPGELPWTKITRSSPRTRVDTTHAPPGSPHSVLIGVDSLQCTVWHCVQGCRVDFSVSQRNERHLMLNEILD